MSNVIRSLIVKVGADTSEFATKMKYISKDLKNTGKNLSNVGSALTKGVTVPLMGAAAGMTSLAIKAGETADELLTMAAQTGLSAEKLQELQYAARFVDVEVETMAKGMAKVTKAIGQANSKNEDYITLANGFTVATKDANGQLKTSEQIFYDSIDAIGGIANETEREIAAQELFGKSYQELMPLIDAGSEGLRKYADEAHKVGAVLSNEDIEAMGAFDDKMQTMKATIDATGSRLGLAFIPILESLMPVIQNNIVPAVQKFSEWLTNLINRFNNLDPGMQKFILGLVGAAAAAGPVLSVVGGLTTKIGGAVGTISKFSKALSGGSTIIGALGTALGPGGAILLGLAAFATVAFTIYKNWDKITGAVKGAISKVKEFLGIDNKSTFTPSTSKSTTASRNIRGCTKYAKGTNYVPNDGLAYLHKGEAVVPTKYNNGNSGSSTVNHTGTVTVRGVNNRDELVAVVEQNITNNIVSGNRRIPNRTSLIPIG